MESEFDTGRPHSMVENFDQHFVGFIPEAPKSEDSDKNIKDITTSNEEYIHFLKERDEAKEALKRKEMEYGNAQGKNFELMKKIDSLEAEIKQLKSAKNYKALNAPSNDVSSSRTSVREGSPRGSPKARRKSVARPTKKAVKTGGQANSAINEPKGPVRHPLLLGKENLSNDSHGFYTEISTSFPDLKLALFLECERKFVDADKNNDGTIDAEELEAVLTNSRMMFTKKQVQDILTGLDTDDTGTLDFMEVLTVLDRLSKNKNAKLPSALEQNKTAVCVVQ